MRPQGWRSRIARHTSFGRVGSILTVRKEWDTMPSRSWMAGLAIVASMIVAGGRARADGPVPVEKTVNVELQLTGVGPEGCRIEIKPGNPACQFKTVQKKISKDDVREVIELDAIPIVAKATGADHDCS